MKLELFHRRDGAIIGSTTGYSERQRAPRFMLILLRLSTRYPLN
jgi:hypothetical protein